MHERLHTCKKERRGGHIHPRGGRLHTSIQKREGKGTGAKKLATAVHLRAEHTPQHYLPPPPVAPWQQAVKW